MSVRRAFRYRLYPTRPQAEKLTWTLARCCELYNAALQERRDAYRKCGASINYHQQATSLPAVKEARPEYKEVHSQVLQDTLRRLDKAFIAFFRRVQHGDRPGYPRFKSARRYDSFCYPQYQANVDGDAMHVYLPKLGNVRIRLHRPLGGAIKTLTIKREVDEWYAVFTCEVEATPLPATGNAVGIDLGLEHFLIASDGALVDNPRHFRHAQAKLRRAQRSLGRKRRGTKRRVKQRDRVAKLHRKVARQRRDFHQKTARALVNDHDVIAHEALNVQGLGRTRLAKSVHDAGWAQFLTILTSKAEEAGRVIVPVNSKYTSQTCPSCGRVIKKRLSERWHSCECGYEAHRDVAAAQVILARAEPSEPNVAVVNASVLREAPL